MLEDLFLAVYLAALAPVLGQADGAVESLLLFGRALGFLILLALVARYGAGLVERVVRSDDDELLVVLFVGFALAVAGAAEVIGVSDAIGAFMAGLVLSGTAARRRIERMVLPLRDAFGALFFFAFGLSIDPGDIGSVVGPAVLAVVTSLVLALAAAIGAARINGLGRIETTNIACSVVARGEFALILVSLAADAGLDTRLAPFTAVYVLTLAIASPIMSSHTGALSRLLPQRLFIAPATH